jgi:glycosyltransferase involved in cell wall biosynthesis
MKRITIDARLFHSGGIGVYLKGVLQALEEEGKYSLYCLCRPQDAAYFRNPIIVKSSIFSWQEQYEIPSRIPKCDLFFAPHFNIPLAPIKAKRRITTLFDAFHLDHPQFLTFFQKVYAFTFFNSAMAYSDHVITISDFSEKRLLHRCLKKPKKISVIYPGVDPKYFSASFTQVERDAILKKYKIKLPFIFFIGNFKPHKNIKRLLLAYLHLCKSGKDTPDLVLAGKKEGFILREDITDLKKEHPLLQEKVHEIGFIENKELPLFYKMCELLVYPSLYEGFGLPPLEAMAAECPVAASRIGAVYEVCKDAVYYFDPYDIFMIKDALEKLLHTPSLKSDLVEKGKKRVFDFTLQKSMKNHLELIDSLL